MLTWVIVGSLAGVVGVANVSTDRIGISKYNRLLAYFVLYGGPAIGGFVVVSQMISAYGVCIDVS